MDLTDTTRERIAWCGGGWKEAMVLMDDILYKFKMNVNRHREFKGSGVTD